MTAILQPITVQKILSHSAYLSDYSSDFDYYIILISGGNYNIYVEYNIYLLYYAYNISIKSHI